MLGDEGQVGMQEEDAAPANADLVMSSYEFEYDFSMQLRYNYRLDPQPRHRIAFSKAFGCARVVFNDALAVREAAHEAGLPYVTDAELSARLTAIKKTPQRAWLNEVSAVVLQQALADLNAAYRNFFASLHGKRGDVAGRHRQVAEPPAARLAGLTPNAPERARLAGDERNVDIQGW